ncbi:MAG: diaminopimelate epimerase, partial [Chloroflexota bacterium]
MSATLPFAKYQGAGNDFLIVDGRSVVASAGPDWPVLARRMCDRHYGVGADGLLVATPAAVAGTTHQMRMFNPDGSEAEMCGNGLRCFVRWLLDRGEIDGSPLAVQTAAGVL